MKAPLSGSLNICLLTHSFTGFEVPHWSDASRPARVVERLELGRVLHRAAFRVVEIREGVVAGQVPARPPDHRLAQGEDRLTKADSQERPQRFALEVNRTGLRPEHWVALDPTGVDSRIADQRQGERTDGATPRTQSLRSPESREVRPVQY